MGHIVSSNVQRRRTYKTGSIEQRGPGRLSPADRREGPVDPPADPAIEDGPRPRARGQGSARGGDGEVPHRGHRDGQGRARRPPSGDCSTSGSRTWTRPWPRTPSRSTASGSTSRSGRRSGPSGSTSSTPTRSTPSTRGCRPRVSRLAACSSSTAFCGPSSQQGVDWDWLADQPSGPGPAAEGRQGREGGADARAGGGDLRGRREPAVKVAIGLAATTGMRRGEVCGLKWSDIDTETGLRHDRAGLGDQTTTGST